MALLPASIYKAASDTFTRQVMESEGVKYPKTPHLPFSPGVQSDDIVLNSRALDQMCFFTQDVVITEKMDGGNCSLYRGKVFARNVKCETTHPSFGPIKQLAAAISYCLPQNIQLCGENMFGIHSLEYDRLDSYFYLFAALEHSADGSHWLPWDHVTELASELSIPTAPILVRKRFDTLEQIEQEILAGMKLPSKCGSCGPEGFVVRAAGGFAVKEFDVHVAKYVREGHVQTEDSWRRTWKPAKLNKN